MKYNYDYTIILFTTIGIIFGFIFGAGLASPEICGTTNNCRTSILFWIIFGLPTFVSFIILLTFLIIIFLEEKNGRPRTQ